MIPLQRMPVMENKLLAPALLKYVEIGNEVPADLFQAVAGVLAYIYGLRRRSIVTEVGNGRG
jgi:flagellar biosynthetic protein FlhB